MVRNRRDVITLAVRGAAFSLPYICRTTSSFSAKLLISLARPTGIEPVFPP